MSAPAIFTSESFPLGRGYAVEFRLEGSRMEAAWSPGLPTGRRGRQLLPAYRKARDTFLRSVAATAGNILVVEA